ncbi:MAG: heat-inducible transcriptional repressor HrcA [Candidatus Merdivicinus sp.]|jgi:heat-inducible transcriptional repressor
MVKALDARKLDILKLVVDRYIRTGEPVGSKTVSEALSYAVSPATIRNDMAALERLGYLEQPHTSAGRVPSYRGYRFYIANLMTRQPLSEYDRRMIEETLLNGDLNPRTLIENAADLLAQVTGCAVASASNRVDFSVITRLDVIPAGRRLYALLLITSSGVVENRVCRLDFELSNEQIAFFVNFIRQNLTGMRIDELTSQKLVELGVSLGNYGAALAPLLYGIYDIVGKLRQQKLEVRNESALLAREDFQTESIKGFLEARNHLEPLLNQGWNGLQIIFGDESEEFCVANSSMIVTGYSRAGKPAGSFGVIGPLRLDYSRLIPYIEYLSDTVSRLITEQYDERKE